MKRKRNAAKGSGQEKNMKKKFLRWMAIATTMAVCLSGCGNAAAGTSEGQSAEQDAGSATEDTAGNGAEGAAEDTKEAAGDTDSAEVSGKVVFAYWGAESENRAIQAAVDDFRANHPEIEVETQWSEKDYLTKVQTQIAGDTMADVYLMSAGDLPGFESNFDAQEADASNYLSESVIEALTINGELKSRPFIVKPKVMAINTTLFEECGVELPDLKEPMTVEEFSAAVEKLSDETAEPRRFGSESPWIGNLLYSFGGSYYRNNGTESNLDSAESIKAADFIIDLRNKGFVPDNTQAEGQSMMEWFLSGRIAIYTDFGPWYIPQLEEVEGFDWELIPYFANGGNKEVDGLSISSNSANKEAAEVFVKWMCESESAQKAIGGDSSAYGVPVNPDAVESFEAIYPGKNMYAYVYAAYNQTPQETQKRTNEINSVLDRINDETGVGTGTEAPADVFPSIAEEVNEILNQ